MCLNSRHVADVLDSADDAASRVLHSVVITFATLLVAEAFIVVIMSSS